MRCWLILLFLCLAAPVRASGPLFTDDFSGDFDWVTVRNAAHFDPAITCNTPAGVPQWRITDGSAEMQIAGSFPCSIEAVPRTDSIAGLRAYLLTMKMFVSEPLMDRNLLIRWQDADNQLGIHLFGSGIFGYKYLGGKPQTLISAERSFNFVKNHWYDVKIEYDLSLRTIRFYLDNVLALEMGEPEGEPQLERGKPGLAASVGEVDHSYVRFDDYRVESLETKTKLSVPFYSQTDPLWKEQEYDQAADWAPAKPTIGRWGCALTSGVMVLRYLGINHLPDQSKLDPGSLNAWLKARPDGYFPGGNLNWRALTSLSHWHSQNFGSMELEMTYENPSDKIGWLKEQLDLARPVILEQPGHFVTAYGYGPGAADIALHDPFYERYRLAEYHQTYDSARLFTPSHTDLSALTVVTPMGTRVAIEGPDGSPLPAIMVYESQIADPKSTGEARGKIQIIDLAKPPDGPVTVKLPAGDLVVPLWIAAYSHQGEVSVRQYLLPPADGETMIPIEFSAVTAPQVDFDTPPIRFGWWELTRLALSQELRSPFLVTLILDYQSRLAVIDNLADAESIERGFRLRLQTAAKNGWLSAFWSELLQNNFHRLLLEKFP